MSRTYLSLLLILLFVSCKNDKKENHNFNSDPGLKKYNDLIAAFPNNDTLFYERAAYLYEQNNFTDAIQDLQKAIKLNPKMAAYYNLLSDAYFDIEAFDESVAALQNLLSLIPEEISILLKLSEIQWIKEDYVAANETVEKIFALSPSESEAYYMRGLINLATQDTLNALEAFKENIILDPQNIEAILLTGQIYEDLGDTEAIKFYDHALRLDPEYMDAKTMKAYYLMGQGKLKDALNLYKEVIIKDKYNGDAFLNVGVIYLQLDSLPQALSHFETLTNFETDNGVGYYYKGITYKLMGNTKFAIENFKQASVFLPDWPEPKNELSLLLNQ